MGVLMGNGKKKKADKPTEPEKKVVTPKNAVAAFVGAAVLVGVADWISGGVERLPGYVMDQFQSESPAVESPAVVATAERVDPVDFCRGSGGWVSPESGDSLPKTWLEARALDEEVPAIPATPLLVDILVQGATESAVVTDVDIVHLQAIEAPSTSAHFLWVLDCGGGPVASVPLGFQLEEDMPEGGTISPTLGRTPTLTPYDPEAFPRTVPVGSPDNYGVTVFYDGTGAYEFDLEVSWADGQREGTITLDNAGEPFRVAGISERNSFLNYVGDWAAATPREVDAVRLGGTSRPQAAGR
ncbi:hypothetical protein [Nocardioides aquaticus]|uniref:hypothetical protein n=1 Tax=Nocardioides aquaticus TaxID=160826 RepID=UPI001BD69C16|nr:hypothetical protein [Nocardioides aquaticus]